MSKADFTILALLLSERREWYGLELVERSEGALARGTVYVHLARLEERGLISSRRDPQFSGAVTIPRRLYKITGDGLRELARIDQEGVAPI